eukprot:SM002248S07293  [mRNA]  locus=s2248:159:293:+ [translate_table: standard]
MPITVRATDPTLGALTWLPARQAAPQLGANVGTTDAFDRPKSVP